jgi:hypothetical protein
MTREEWLNQLAENLRPLFDAVGTTVPDRVRVSVGWPSARGLAAKKRTIGQCWSPKCSADQATEIFISPWLGDGGMVAETLLHEMIHAAVGTEVGHKGAFVACGKKLGFTAPWKSTPASGELKAKLAGLLPGDYPHAALDSIPDGKKKQSTRMVKVVCAGCGYTARTTRKWLDEAGAPICPCNQEPMEAAKES